MILIFLASLSLYGQKSSFDPEKSSGKLYEYAEYARAGNWQLSPDELLPDNLLQFSCLSSENHSVGFTSDYYWVRFRLSNSQKTSRAYYLETARPMTDLARLYKRTPSGIERFESGDQVPFGQRQVVHRATVFKLELPPESVTEWYLELKSDGETINLPLQLSSEEAFWKSSQDQQLFLGIFYGILLIAGMIYLFFYSSLKEKAFLYYGIYVGSILLFQATLDGLVFQYLLPSGGYLNDRAVLLTALLCNFFLLKYCEHFLRLRVNTPLLHRVFMVVYAVIALLMAGTLAGPAFRELVYPVSNVNGLISLLLILTVLGRLRYRRIAVDPYFTLGICFLVLGLMGFVLNNLGVLPNTFFIQNSAKFGCGLEVIFLSLSMTNLIRKLRLEKENSQQLALTKSEEISELKTCFMSNISHELRTPLNAIMGVVNSRSEPGDGPGDPEDYAMIRHAALSLLSNINDILDFDKIAKNELRLRQEVFNPASAIRQISEHWKAEAQKKGLSFDLCMDADLPNGIRADRERLLQILNNILSNAVKFTTAGSIRFQVNGVRDANCIYHLGIETSDSGVGMDMQKKEAIFDSFSQMRLNDKRTYGGIGLGMSIVKHLVTLFEGDIRLESEPGQGTRVCLELPVQLIKPSGLPIVKGGQVETTGERALLVVEDNPMNQLVMRKLLGKWPHLRYDVVSNGKEALGFLKSNPCDLILMDLQMPVMDGYEATGIIRGGTHERVDRNIPIIAVTADTTEATRKRVTEMGMNAYVSKPVDPDLLYEAIRQQLQYLSLAG